jgi:hypothetical protein
VCYVVDGGIIVNVGPGEGAMRGEHLSLRTVKCALVS